MRKPLAPPNTLEGQNQQDLYVPEPFQATSIPFQATSIFWSHLSLSKAAHSRGKRGTNILYGGTKLQAFS